MLQNLSQKQKDKLYNKITKHFYLFLNKYIYLILIGLYLISELPQNISHNLLDADCFMWGIKIKNFITSPSFFEQPIYQSNYPFGEINHWTLPFKLIYLIITTPFLLTHNLNDAILIGGSYISPILGGLTVFAIIYGLKKHFNTYLIIFSTIFFYLYYYQKEIFTSIRPDHHSLNTMLFMFALANIYCWLKNNNIKYIKITAISLALLSFSAIEGFILYILIICYFLYNYILSKNTIQKNITELCTLTKIYAYSSTIFWLINPPYEGYFFPDNGRISILYIIIYWLIFISFYILKILSPNTINKKISYLSLLSILSITLIIEIFGFTILSAPLNENIQAIWSDHIYEMKPFYKLKLPVLIQTITFPILSLIFNIYLLKYPKHKKILSLNLYIGLILFALTLFAIRFNNYIFAYIIIPYICLIDIMYKKTNYSKNKTGLFPVQIYVLAISILLLEIILQITHIYIITNKNTTQTFTYEICALLKQNKGTLVSDTFLTPKYSNLCDVTVVATPYHRNIEGILDNHNIIFKTEDEDIIPLIKKHQVSTILLFDNYYNILYNLDSKNQNKLYYRLIMRTNVPDYLEEIHTSNKNARLYKVKLK